MVYCVSIKSHLPSPQVVGVAESRAGDLSTSLGAGRGRHQSWALAWPRLCNWGSF